MNLLWTIVIGLVAGVLARLIAPGMKEPSGFLLTALLGVIGAFAGTSLGEEAGWYDAGESAGLIGAILGAVIILAIWGFLFRRRSTSCVASMRSPVVRPRIGRLWPGIQRF